MFLASGLATREIARACGHPPHPARRRISHELCRLAASQCIGLITRQRRCLSSHALAVHVELRFKVVAALDAAVRSYARVGDNAARVGHSWCMIRGGTFRAAA